MTIEEKSPAVSIDQYREIMEDQVTSDERILEVIECLEEISRQVIDRYFDKLTDTKVG